jgi:hypothetical protein
VGHLDLYDEQRDRNSEHRIAKGLDSSRVVGAAVQAHLTILRAAR